VYLSFNTGKSVGKLPYPAGGKTLFTGSDNDAVTESDGMALFQPVV
jgi:hypothetical protein